MNKPAGILFALSRELGAIIGNHLAQEDGDEEKLWLEVLLTLNKEVYRNKLLFTDYRVEQRDEWLYLRHGRQRIYREADFYLHAVLGRRLAVANNLSDKATNMHNLLTAYCCLHQDARWRESCIVRGKEMVARDGDFFSRTAAKLERQCKRLGDAYGEVSARRRAEFGAFWLQAEGCAAETAEELSLFDVIEAAPRLLDAEQDTPLLLLKVLESLNEKYGLLRSCGLPPDEWFGVENLSVAQLEQLKQLQKSAKSLIAQGCSKEIAYRNAFAGLQKDGGKVAGFKTFGEFQANPLAERIFYPKRLAAKSGDDNDDEDDAEVVGKIGSNDADLLALLIEHADVFDAVTAYAFEYLIVEGGELHGKQGLINDAAFLQLAAQHPDYRNLPPAKLLALLRRRLGNIIEMHIETQREAYFHD